ncbi:MAG: hypothetical protein ACR2IV_11710 [Bryobacteraceae bacterium]
MVDLESDQPTFYYTFEAVADYEGNDEEIWKSDRLGPPVVTPTGISFDIFSENWEPSLNPMKMKLEADGYYHSRNQPEWGHANLSHHYYGLRSESPTHIVIAGRWSDEGFGKGVFIVVIPKTLDSK